MNFSIGYPLSVLSDPHQVMRFSIGYGAVFVLMEASTAPISVSLTYPRRRLFDREFVEVPRASSLLTDVSNWLTSPGIANALTDDGGMTLMTSFQELQRLDEQLLALSAYRNMVCYLEARDRGAPAPKLEPPSALPRTCPPAPSPFTGMPALAYLGNLYPPQLELLKVDGDAQFSLPPTGSRLKVAGLAGQFTDIAARFYAAIEQELADRLLPPYRSSLAGAVKAARERLHETLRQSGLRPEALTSKGRVILWTGKKLLHETSIEQCPLVGLALVRRVDPCALEGPDGNLHMWSSGASIATPLKGVFSPNRNQVVYALPPFARHVFIHPSLPHQVCFASQYPPPAPCPYLGLDNLLSKVASVLHNGYHCKTGTTLDQIEAMTLVSREEAVYRHLRWRPYNRLLRAA